MQVGDARPRSVCWALSTSAYRGVTPRSQSRQGWWVRSVAAAGEIENGCPGGQRAVRGENGGRWARSLNGTRERARSEGGSTECDELDQARRRGRRRGPSRPRGAGERPARPLLLQPTRDRYGRPKAAAVRASHSAGSGCSRAGTGHGSGTVHLGGLIHRHERHGEEQPCSTV